MAVPKIGLKAVLEMAGFNKGIKEYNSAIRGAEQSTDEAATGMERGLNAVGAVIGTVAVAAGTAIGAFYALKKAMEMGREGAVILQTAQSFDYLMEKVGASADIMGQLRAASNNTVDNMKLMTSTTSLLAGTQGELSKRMAEAAPKLLEIAKAANKLKPALGDTTFLYESLATGIKRSSPMLIDNLDIILKIGTANEQMAEKLGKTVEELSAEEKQVAILEETLRAGQVMIDQVGGSTESATDDFDRLKVALKNASDEAKTRLVPTLAEVASGLADVINLTLLYNKNLEGLQAASVAGADSYNDYALAMIDGAVAMGVFTDKQVEALRAHLAQGKALDDFVNELPGYTLGVEDLVAQIDLMTTAEYNLIQAEREVDAQRQDAIDRLNVFENATATGTVAVEDQEKALRELERQLRATQKRYEMYYGSLAKGILSIRNANKAIKDARKDGAKAIGDINKDLGTTVDDIQEKYDKLLPEPTDVGDRAQMTEDVWDEHYLRMGALMDGADTDSERFWLNQTQQWTEGTAFMQREGESQEAWLGRVRQAYYDNALPPEFYNTQTEQYQAFVNEKKRLGDEEIAEAQRVANKLKHIETQKKNAAIKAAKERREQVLILTALQVLESLGLLQDWAYDTQGAMAPALDSAQEVFDAMTSGSWEADQSLTDLITVVLGGLIGTLKDTEDAAGDVQQSFHDMVTTAQQDAADMLLEYTNLTTALDEGQAAMGDFLHPLQAEPEPKSFFDYVLDSHGLLVDAMLAGELSDAVTTEGGIMQADLEAVGTKGVMEFGRIKTAIRQTTTLLNIQLKKALKETGKTATELAKKWWEQFISNPHSMLNAVRDVKEEARKLADVLREIRRLINWINAHGVPEGAGEGDSGGEGSGEGDSGEGGDTGGNGGAEMAIVSAPALTSPAYAGAGVNVNIGDVTINSDMDAAMFEARVQQAVIRAVRGV